MAEQALKAKRNGFKRAQQIAEELGVGRPVVERILERERELRKEELLESGTTTILGLCTIKANFGDEPEEVIVRGRVSSTLEGYLIRERLKQS